MIFRLEFPPRIRDEIRSWSLDSDLMRQFYERLLDESQSDSFMQRLTAIESDLFEYADRIPHADETVYTFVLHLDRADELWFRVVQCSAYATRDRRMIWSSP